MAQRGEKSWSDQSDDSSGSVDGGHRRGTRTSNRRERGPRGNRQHSYGDGQPTHSNQDGSEQHHDEQRERWTHDMYGERRGDGDRRNRNHGGRNNSNSNNVLLEKIERGVVCAIKDGFGFIQSIDREADLFFHFTELPKDFTEEVKKGLEVEYQVATDRRSGKISAVNIQILPPGTVVFEELSLDRYRGVVSREISNKRGLENPTGVIDTKLTDGSILGLPFGVNDVENPNLVLQVGDEVEFNILLQKKQQQQIATVIRVVKFSGERETGIVNNILEDKGFGFINCCDRDARLYFHFSELMCPEEDVQPGTEVEFSVAMDKRSDKISATRIFPLPKGTVTFETMLETRVTGIVESDLTVHYDRQKERREEPGVIVVNTVAVEGTENSTHTAEQKYYFRSKDLADTRARLRPGDEVEFNPLIEKRTKKFFSTRLVLIRAAPEVREQGVVASIKNSNGFITAVERLEEVAFHLSEFEDYKKQQRVDVGTEVEFSIVQDHKSGKMRAMNIRALPKGTVSFEEVLEGVHTGRVVKEATRGGRSGSKEENGLIEFDIQIDGGVKKETVGFTPKVSLQRQVSSSETQASSTTPESTEEGQGKIEESTKVSSSSSSYLVPGDVVEFNVAVEKRTKARTASNIKLLEEVKLPREKGYVCKIKPKSSSGYIRRLEDISAVSTPAPSSENAEVAEKAPATSSSKPSNQLFFYFSDVKKSGKTREDVMLGLPVEFSTFPSSSPSKQSHAVRVTILPQELVVFEEALEGTFQGIVEKDLRRKKSGPKDPSPGSVAHILTNGEKETLEFTEIDVNGLKLRAGESVEFSIVVDKFTKTKRATNVKRGKQRGIVRSSKPTFGFIERYDKLAKEQLFFQMPRDVALRVGDEVEFTVVFNDKKDDINAQSILRIREAPEPVPVNDSSSSSSSTPIKSKLALQRKTAPESPLISVLRNPRMPDTKTKGFSAELRNGNSTAALPPTPPTVVPVPGSSTEVASLTTNATEVASV